MTVIWNNEPPIKITVPAPQPVVVEPRPVAPLVVTQLPGVGARGPAGPEGPAGPAGLDTAAVTSLAQAIAADAIAAHVVDAEPHPAYDDIPSLTLIFENHLI